MAAGAADGVWSLDELVERTSRQEPTMPTDADFIKWLEAHEAWYETWSTFWGILLVICRILSLSSSIISIVVAAAITPEYFSSTGRWLIIIAGALTAISSEMLSQLKVREMEELREDGHLEMSAIVAYAHQKFEEYAGSPERISKLKDEIRERVHTVERNQHRRHGVIDGSRQIEAASN